MKKRMLLIISIIIICFFSISCVNAESNLTNDILGDDLSYKSFTDLQSLIQDSSGVVELTDNYKYNSTIDTSDFSNGIFIPNPVTINGNGHSIDALNKAKIFTITGSNVLLNNITFKNAYGDLFGGAISWSGTGGSLLNCQFDSCKAKIDGGAIYWSGTYAKIDNSKFTSCSAFEAGGSSGGAVMIAGKFSNIQNSIFDSNIGQNGGGLAISGDMPYLDNLTFVNNYATSRGGGLYVTGGSCKISNCKFINNSAQGQGGGAYFDAWAQELTSLTFVNNSAALGGGLVFKSWSNGFLVNSEFYNNHAAYGAGAILEQGQTGLFTNLKIINNSANGYGGAICLNHAILRFSDIINNTAYVGGGVYASGGEIYNDTHFSGNAAEFLDSIALLDNVDLHGNFDCDIGYVNVTDDVSPLSRDVYKMVKLSNGYYAYCNEKYGDGPNDAYFYENIDLIKNRLTGEFIGEYLKILIYDNINSKQDALAVDLTWDIYEFTDGDFRNSRYYPKVKRAISLYNRGLRIPNNATKILQNGTVVNYNFASYITSKANQNLFCFYINESGPVNKTLIKDTLNKTVFVGENVEFNVTLNNQYNFTMCGIVVEDHYSNGLSYVGWNPTHGDWTYNETTKQWHLDSLKSGDVASFVVKFKTTISGVLNNTVVSWSRNTTEVYDNNTTRTYLKNLTIEKIALNPTVFVGNQTTFKIVVKNTGEVSLADVKITEVSYGGLIYDSYKSDESWDYSNNVWVLKRILEPGETVSIDVTFNTTRVGNFTNIVCVSSNITENKTTNNTTTVLKADLEVKKIALTPKVKLGDLTSFEIYVHNIGDVELSNVCIVEESYPGLIYDSWNEDKLWTYDVIGGKHTWTLNRNLTLGEKLAIEVYFKTNSTGNFVNTAVVSSNETENKTVTNNTTVLKPAMDVKKIALNQSVSIGDIAIFEIIVNNVGEVDLYDITLNEVIPDGLDYLGYRESKFWTYKGNYVWKANAPLLVNEKESLIVYFNATKVGNLTNEVFVSSNQTENKTSNNTTEVLKCDLYVEKIAHNKTVAINEIVTFEIFVKNTGEIDLTDVTVKDIPQEGLNYVGYRHTNDWNYVGGVWKLNRVLEPQASSVIYVYYNATKLGNLTNTAVVSSNKTENKTDNDTVEVLRPHMSVVKIAKDKTVSLGSNATFEIVVHNDGETDLNNVQVSDIVPEGLIFLSQNSRGLWDYSNGVWILKDTLKVGEYAAFYVTFATNKTGNLTNTVVATSNETGNITNETNVTVLSGNLSVRKITLNHYVAIGESIAFEIFVENTGEIDLHDVYIIEESYEGLIYEGYSNIDDWSYSDGKWILNHVLKPGQFTGLLVYFISNKTGNFTNYASAGSNETNKTYTNNTTEVFNTTEEIPISNSTEIESLDLIKTALNKQVTLGDKAIFQIVVHNTGTATLYNVTVSEVFYGGLIYDSFVDYTGLFTKNSNLSWTVDVLYPGEFLGFTVYFNTTKPGEFVNVVSDGNKTDNDTVKVLKPSYTIEKIALNKNLHLGDLAVFEIMVHNDGEVNLDNITVSELLFEGLDYLYFVDYLNSWEYVGDLTWSLNNTLVPGEYSGFFVYFNTTLPGKFINMISSGNKTANDTVEVRDFVFDIEKIAVNKVVKLGDQVIFEIVVHNSGEIPLNNVVVREIFYDGLIYDHYIDENGLWSYDNLTWTLNDLLVPGEYSVFSVVFNTTEAGKFTNVVSYDNKTANDTVEVFTPEYEIGKVALEKSVVVGDEVTFEIYVHNTGKVNVDNITINESSFDGLEFVSFVDNSEFWDYAGNLSWTLNRFIAPGAYVGFFVTFKTTKSGELVNVITSGNKSANDTVEVNKPQYEIDKIVLNKTVQVGEQVIFEIVVHNSGKVAIDNITVVESSFVGLEYVGYLDSTGRWVNNGLSWTLSDTLTPGEYIVFFVIFNTTSEGNFTNTIISGNLTENDTVEVLKNETPSENKTTPDVPDVPSEEIPAEEVVVEDKSEVKISSETGNPILLILLVLLNLVILRRRK